MKSVIRILPLCRLKNSLEDERAVAIASMHRACGGDGRQRPTTVLGAAKQGCEAGPRIESRQTQPVDGAIPSDQSGSMAIADQRIVFNR